MDEPLSEEDRQAEAQALVDRTEALRRKIEEREAKRSRRYGEDPPNRLPYSDPD